MKHFAAFFFAIVLAVQAPAGPLFFGNNYTTPAVGGGVTWGGVVQQWSGAINTTKVITLTGGIPSGSIAIIRWGERNANTLTATDSRGNTWTAQVQQGSSGYFCGVLTAPVTTTLSSGDTITLTAGTGSSFVAAGDVCYVTGATAVDATGNNSTGGSATSLTQTVTTTGSTGVIVGVTTNAGQAQTSVTWTQDYQASQSMLMMADHTTTASAGTYNNSVTWSTGTITLWAVVAFK